MKKLLLSLLLLPSFLLSQSGDGYVNYTSYRTQCNAGCVFSRTVDGTSVTVNGHMSDTAEFDAAMTVISTSTAVSVLNSGETQAFSAGGFGTATNSYNGGRPIGPGNSQGEYYIVDYTGWFYASSTGNYKFHTWSDDSHEFWLDLDGDEVLESTEMITKKYNGSGNNQSSNISLTSGTWYKLRVRFHEFTGGDWMRIQYQDPTNNGGTTWRILGDTTWGDKVSNAEPAPTFTNNASEGQNAVYYKVFSINGGDGNTGSHHPDNASQFTTLFDTSTAGTEWTHQGRDTATKALTWPWPNTLPRPNSGVWFGWEITGYFVPEETGTYEFKIASDDRSDFFIDTDNDDDLSDETELVYYYEGPADYEATISLTKDTPYKFRVRYENGAGSANLYLKWTKPSDTADNHTFNSDEIYSVKPEDVPLHYDINLKFKTFDETNFAVDTYYESDSSLIKNSNSSTITLDANGEATISSQIDETLVGQGKYDITATPGSVEWVVTYSPMVTNKYTYRIGLDVREFPNGVDLDDVNNIELLDLVDTDGSTTYNGSELDNSWSVRSHGTYWNEFNYVTWNAIPFSSSNYSSSIRSLSGGGYALKVELNFNEVTAYKTQYVVLDTPNTTNPLDLVDTYLTVADAYLGFQELTDRGINMNESGNKFDYSVQYANGDIDGDGAFDFDDTYLMLDYLNGGTDWAPTDNSNIVMLTDQTTYDNLSTSTWTSNNTTRKKYPLGLATGTKTYDKSVAVHWKGDINLSHSPTPTNDMTVTGAPPPMYMVSQPMLIDLHSVSEIKNDKLHVTIRSTNAGIPIGALQLKLLYNKEILTLDSHDFNSGGTNFMNDGGGSINFGSLKTTEGSLNNQTVYEFVFDTKDKTGSLGLTLVKPVEAVTTNNEQVFIQLQ